MSKKRGEKDRILEKLRNGVPLEEIKSRSWSSKTNAAKQFLSEAGEEIRNLKMILEGLQGEVDQLRANKTHLEAETKGLTDKKSILFVDLEDVEKGMLKLQEEMNVKSIQLSELNSHLMALNKKGITIEIVELIHRMEVYSGEELLERVKTANNYREVQIDLAKQKKEKNKLETEVSALEEKKSRLTKDVHSEKMRLDEEQMKVPTFKEAVKVVTDFFLGGYRTIDLERLRHGLDLLAIKGDPQLSIDRLTHAMEEAKTLTELKLHIEKNKREYKTLNENLELAKGELTAIRDITLQAIETTRKFALNSIKNTQNSAQEAIERVEGDGLKYVKTLADESVDRMEKEGKETFRRFREEADKWSELKQEAGEYKEYLVWGKALLGILETEDIIEEVPTPLIARLMHRIYVWMSHAMPDVKAESPHDLKRKDLALSSTLKYKLPVLAEFLMLELEKRALEEEVPKVGS